MVEAGFTETSALKTVGVPGPFRGSITRDSAVFCSLAFCKACATLGGRVLLTGAAQTEKARGKTTLASNTERKDLIIRNKTLLLRRVKKARGMEENPSLVTKVSALCPKLAPRVAER